MNMTAPVTHEVTAVGSHRYRFVMERAYSEATLPDPLDDTVSISRARGGYYAAWRYRGNRDEKRYLRSKKALLDALDRDAITVVGSAASAVYDGPFVPAPLRRNEVLVPVSYPEWRAA